MTVDIAFVGAGGIASKHLEHLTGNDRANVAAVCDIDEDAADEWASTHDATAYYDWEVLFDEADFDAVFVCVPPFAHEGQELRAIEEGVDLFVEKPLALDRDYAREVEHALERSDVITQVGHHFRYLDCVEHARELVGDRTLATVYGQWVGGVPGGDGHWWRSREQSGGQVVEQSTHVFDLVRYFGGDVERVAAEGDLRVREDVLDFPDAVAATLHHDDGLPSQVTTSAASPSGDVGVTLVGDGVHLDLRVHENVCEGVVDGEDVHFEGENDGHHTEVDEFVAAVDEGDASRCRSPYGDAVQTFATTLAVSEAVDQEGKLEVSL
ncbi:Gfo/Idh/MocA family protein [Halarchaeum sp. P4]|uniref:Gfo/Idh/MocA family protein n=1 Tax=Halarchaeum sp. P4 TaxID=3421639 RepID=UPI003EBE6FE2